METTLKLISVAKSCKTVEQLATCLHLASRILDEEDYLFSEVFADLPNADFALLKYKEEMRTLFRY